MIQVALAAMALGGCSSGTIEPGNVEDGKAVTAPFRILPLGNGAANERNEFRPVDFDSAFNFHRHLVGGYHQDGYGDDYEGREVPPQPGIEFTAAGNIFLNGAQSNLDLFDATLNTINNSGSLETLNMKYGARLVDHEGNTIAECKEGAWDFSFLNRLKEANDAMRTRGDQGRMERSDAIKTMADICDVSEDEVESALAKLSKAGEVSLQLNHRQNIMGEAPSNTPPTVRVAEVSYGHGKDRIAVPNTGVIKS
jgi:hypothetical protein